MQLQKEQSGDLTSQSRIKHHSIPMTELFPRQVNKKSRGPQRERGLEFSRRRKGQTFLFLYIPSVQFSRSVVSDSLRPHELQHARPTCLSPTPEVYSNSRPSSRWCHPAISSSVIPFSYCPQSLPASESFPMSQLFAWGGQNIGVSASASFLWKNTQDWSLLEWTG